MGYIYKITNLINSKAYIGKTTTNIQERFRQHCQDAYKSRCNKRPLYDAINKYGIENFKIEEIEQVDNDKLSDREIYWIEELQTYGRTGYNATKGGDGSIIYDHHEIVDLLNLGYTVSDIQLKMGCCSDTIHNVAKANNIKILPCTQYNVLQYDKAGNYVNTFNSKTDAAIWIKTYMYPNKRLNTISKHIGMCCNKLRNTAYNYVWIKINRPRI